MITSLLVVPGATGTGNTGSTTPSVGSITVSPALSPGSQVVTQGHSAAVSATIPSSGTPPYRWQWLYSLNGGASYTPAGSAQCLTPGGDGATPGAVETCSFATTDATPTGTYSFALRITDSASEAETVTSPVSTTISVERGSTTSEASADGAPALQTDPQEDCTGGCTNTNWFGGTRGSGNLAVTTTSTNELLVLEITDSGQTGADLSTADLADTQGSTWTLESTNEWDGAGHFQYVFYALDGTAGADTITVDTAAGTHTDTTDATAVLSAFTGVDTSAPIAAIGTFEDGTGTQSSASVTTHVSPTTILGVVSTTDGSSDFAATTSPAFTEAGTINDGAATASFLEYYAASATGTYTSEPTWTGSVHWGAVAIAVQGASPLSVTIAPTAVTLDQGQSVTETATATGGTGTLTYTWSIASGSCPGFANSGAATLTYSPSGTSTNCVLTVTVEDADGHTAQPATSAAVTVNSELAAPATPTVSATALDVNQAETVTGTIPSSGTPTYAWTWLVSVSGSAYAAETECTTNGGTGAAAGATETCTLAAARLTAGDTYNFELKVTDSATTAETSTSAASATVSVASQLAAPAAPSVSATKLDLNQALTVSGTIPTSGTAPYSWTWLASADGGAYATATECATDEGTGAAAGATKTCAIGSGDLVAGDTYNFELQVEDGASTPETAPSAASSTVSVSTELAAPAAPTVSAAALDVNQAETVTGTIPSTGTATYSWTWLVSVGDAAYADASQCAANSGTGAAAGATETCVIAAATLTAGTTYSFELEVTDSATVAETATSPASPTVTVSSALSAPAAPTVSATALDLNQAETVTGTIPSSGTPSYAWTWLVSVNAGAYGTATQCAVNSGTGAAGGATETCAIGASDLTAGDTYGFELQVKDSASTAESVTSPASSTIAVKAALTAPATPTIGAAKIDRNQAETVTGTIPSTGTATYAWTWMVSVSGGAYAAATQCATNSGSGAAAGATETCTIAANTLTAGDAYAFELKVTDSATTPETATSGASASVTVASTLAAPAAPTNSATKLDLNQGLTIDDAIPTSGTATYSWQWLVSVNGGTYADATVCATNAGSGAAAGATETCSVAANGLTTGDNYAFELEVTDGATTPESVTSAASATVTVSSALSAPAAPTLSASALDLNQAMTISGNVPSTGTAPYSWAWLVSLNGGAYATATECAVDDGSGAAAGAAESCSIAANTLSAGTTLAFKLESTDSATSAETVTSPASGTTAVESALAAPAAPIPNATGIDLSTILGVSGTLPTSGSSSYSWQWLVSQNGSGYADATVCGSSASGTGGAAGEDETCTVPADTLTGGANYTFELEVTDSASNPESATSGASADVAVSSDLVGGAPSPPSAVLDDGQSVVLSANADGGSGGNTYQWYEGASASACVALGSPITGATGATYSADPSSTTYYCYVVDDSDGDAVTSGAALLTVNSALLAPSAPTVSATALDSNQAVSVTASIPDAGTAPYSWEWLVSVDGAGAVAATQCATDSGTGGAADATETCSVAAGTLTVGDSYAFTLEITDSSGAGPESAISGLSHAIAVSAALAAPAVPTVSTSSLLLSQVLTVSGTLPSSGSPDLAWQWLASTNGGAFEDAAACGSSASGTGGAGGADVTCTVPEGALVPGDVYTFELAVTDSATVAESATSVASSAVTVARPAVTGAAGQGPVGASYVVSGSGFSASGLVTVMFGSTALAPTSCTEGTVSGTAITTNANGEFDCTFRVPAVASGAYSVTALDEASSSSTVALSFTVTTPRLVVTPSTGSVGSTVTVNGTGFSVSTALASLLFDSEAVTSCLSGSLTTNATGAFSCSFLVPKGVTGSTVVATDSGGSTAEAQYAAIAPAASPATFGSWIWLVLVAVVVGILLIVVLARRRRSSARPASASPDVPPEGPAPSGPLAIAAVPSAAEIPSPVPASGALSSEGTPVALSDVPVPVPVDLGTSEPSAPIPEPIAAPAAGTVAPVPETAPGFPDGSLSPEPPAPAPGAPAEGAGDDPEAVARIVFPEFGAAPTLAPESEAVPTVSTPTTDAAPALEERPPAPDTESSGPAETSPLAAEAAPVTASSSEPVEYPEAEIPSMFAPAPTPESSTTTEPLTDAVSPEPAPAVEGTAAAPTLEEPPSALPEAFEPAPPAPAEPGAPEAPEESGMPAPDPSPQVPPESVAPLPAEIPPEPLEELPTPRSEESPAAPTPRGDEPPEAPAADAVPGEAATSLSAEPSDALPEPAAPETRVDATEPDRSAEGPTRADEPAEVQTPPESWTPAESSVLSTHSEPDLEADAGLPPAESTAEWLPIGTTPDAAPHAPPVPDENGTQSTEPTSEEPRGDPAAESGPESPDAALPSPAPTSPTVHPELSTARETPPASGSETPVTAGPLAAARLSTFFRPRTVPIVPPTPPVPETVEPPSDETATEGAPVPTPPPTEERSEAPTAETYPDPSFAPSDSEEMPDEPSPETPPAHSEFPSFHSVPAPRSPPREPAAEEAEIADREPPADDGMDDPPADDPS